MGFDKFAWIDAIAADARLPDGERFVLTMTAIKYVRYGDDTYQARQVTIAERFAISVRTVQRAQANARQLGYLERVQLRPRRGPGHHSSDQHRLLLPDNLSPLLESHDNLSANCGVTRQNGSSYTTKVTELPDRADAQTSADDALKGLYKGLKKGTATAGAGGPQGPAPPRKRPKAQPTQAFGHTPDNGEPNLPRHHLQAIQAARANLDRQTQQTRQEENS